MCIRDRDNIAKERLKSEISHDIRTPLNVVVGFAALLTGKEELDKETKSCLLYTRCV